MWFLEQNTASKIESAAINFKPSAEQESQFVAFSAESSNESESRIMKVAGDTAQINIEGILTQKPDIISMIFGGGNITYQEIISAIASAEQDDDIKNIVFAVDSPGGDMSGLFSTIDAMRSISKPTKAIVSNIAASAAYALVAQADEIVAVNEATQVGSIGIMAVVKINDNIINVKSTLAPKKNPDVTTKEGQDSLREHLDAVHEIFVQTIARGRSKTPDVVNKDFGQGGLLLAEKAMEVGMVDSISNAVTRTTVGKAITEGFKATDNIGKIKASKTKEGEGSKIMDLIKFKAEHPALYAQVVDEGKEAGVLIERERVEAHLTMGAAFGAVDIALKAIKDGDEMNHLFSAKYQSAKADKEALAAVAGDNVEGLDTSGALEGSSELAEKTATIVEEHYGIEAPKATV